LYLVCGERGF
nr:Chain C, Insulin [Homo sapiens]4Z78_F Chain F, Insulin [Homo sapiens]4Z78_I Chain I, Insulin [Homo sapiens]